jgi:23S rRNA pseudouridine1911/1915/1917 synthase
VIAKTAHAHRVLCRHFQQKMVEKSYLAIATGVVADDSGTIEAPIGRFADKRIWAVKPDGKAATSKFEVLMRGRSKTLVGLEPVTGRTNQLRIHLAHIGHPILGDVRYGGDEYSRLCLHAAGIAFAHPTTGVRIAAESPVPSEMEFFDD